MKKKIIPIVALVLALSMALSVPAFAAVGPDEEIDLIDSILTEGSYIVSEEIGEYATLSPSYRNNGVWDITVNIKDPNVAGRDVYYDIIEILVDLLNSHSNELESIAPRNDPTAAITLSGAPVSNGQIVDFVLALGLTNEAGEPFTPDTPIGDLVGQGFMAVIVGRSGAEYYWVVHFARAEAM